MTTHLLIAGHGETPGGGFDPGATGFISKGEHRYVEQDLFPAMKKYVPKGADIVFFTDYNVFAHGNLASLAKKYGKDTIVTEVHFDATGSSAARGGHVIVYSGYAPDALDLRYRDAIKQMVSVRYNHKGHTGISGRNNLGNVNRARAAGINYRLLELGFGTNKTDANIMTGQVDQYAKVLVEAILNTDVKATPSKPAAAKPAAKPVAKPATSNKTVEQLAQEVIAGKHGTGDARKKALGSQYDAVQRRVNELAGVKPKASKSIDQLAKEVIAGKHGTGDARKKALGSQYDAVQKRVNELAGVKPKVSKSINQLAQEVIDGKHGSGDARKKALGSQYAAVQKRVNQLL